jgi:protein SCO1/2
VRRSRLAAATLVAGALVLSGCAQQAPSASPVADVSVHDDDGLHGVVLPKPYDVPHLRLTDTQGASYALDGSSKPVTLVYFGYTHCPDICQVVMANLASALTRLDPDRRAEVGMLFVTTDPARDDPRTLREYLDRFDPRFEGLTGPLPRIVTAGKTLGVPIQKGARLPSGGYEVSHGTQVVGMLPRGTAPVVWTEGTSPADIAADLTTILDHGVPSPGGSK